jgi:hypothetical protein
MPTTIGILLETVLYIRSVQIGYKEGLGLEKDYAGEGQQHIK